jgi:hypothetical protein
MTRFGDFAPLCTHTPSYPWCNLFYRQVRPLAAALGFWLIEPNSRPSAVEKSFFALG